LSKAYAINNQTENFEDKNPADDEANGKNSKIQIDTRILDKITVLQKENNFLREKTYKMGKDFQKLHMIIKKEKEDKETAYAEIQRLRREVGK
jgi:hypothetical protein